MSTCCHTRNKPHQCRLGSRLRAPFLDDLCSVVFAPHLCVIAVLMYAGEPIFQVWHFCFIISTSNYWPILLFTLVSRIILWACLLRDENIQCDKDLATKEEKNSSSFEGTPTMPLPLRDRSDYCSGLCIISRHLLTIAGTKTLQTAGAVFDSTVPLPRGTGPIPQGPSTKTRLCLQCRDM